MAEKTNTRITVDIPTTDHKKLKMLAAFHGKSMREILVELIEHGLERYQETHPENTVPNETTKKGLKKATSVEDLFKKLAE